MNNPLINRRFTGVLLVGLSVISLILLRLQLWVLTTGNHQRTNDLSNLDLVFTGGSFHWTTVIAVGGLFLSLILTVLVSLFNLRLCNRLEGDGHGPTPTRAANGEPREFNPGTLRTTETKSREYSTLSLQR